MRIGGHAVANRIDDHLNRRGRRLLEQFGRFPATLTLTVPGASVPSSWPVTFRAAERP